MRRQAITIGLAILSILALSQKTAAQESQAVDLTGDWGVSVEGPQGVRTMTVKLVQAGQELLGVIEAQMGEMTIEDGSVDGNAFRFTVTVTRGARSLAMTYVGTVEGDAMAGSVTNPRGEAPFTGKRTGG